MALFLAPLLLFLLAAHSGMGEQGLHGFQSCKQMLNVSVLGALPGAGWDNLRNVELEQVLRRDYSQCLTSEDGEYLIPDQMSVVPRRESVVESRAELIDNWVNYTDIWAASINAEVSFLSKINGKFSTECQQVKKYNLEYKTVTMRVQIRHHIYSVKASESPDFHPAFLQHLLTLSEYLENNQTHEAEYLADMLVFRFGTHVLTDMEVGATLVQEDQVRRELVEGITQNKINITLAASALFFKKVNFAAEASWQKQNQLLQDYVRGTVASKIHSHGGVPFYPGITLQKWQESIGNRLVAIGRSGLPLPELLLPESLPQLPAPAVRRLAAAVQNAIKRYYAVNTHPGCLKLGEPGFDPQANVDDGSCKSSHRANFPFGGVFQECQVVSGKDAKDLCQPYRIANPLTGKASCPANYTASALSSQLKTWSEVRPECKKQCNRCWLFFQCCHTVCSNREYRKAVRLSASWCSASGASQPTTAGFLFGGLYSPGHPNPFTRAQTCPSSYYPLTLFGELKVCVSSDSELGAAPAVPFGGFFSCQVGNPLAGLLKNQSPGLLKEVFYQDSSTKYPMKCPAGYSQHQAYLFNGCQVLYCLPAGALLSQQLAAVRLPPFIPRPLLLNRTRAVSSSVAVDSNGQQVWVRLQGSNHWQQTSVRDLSLSTKFSSQPGSGTSFGTIFGSWMAAMVVVAALALGVSYGFRYYKKRGCRKPQEGIFTEGQKDYGATEATAEPHSV
ncbi:macrophage-expressed gene 1 protein-like [Sus scrofa]|uniref:Macrophage-expressed gene 1 protein-like n=1 Tax=Sus scrofa TaxID=9823 RepID=A0A8D1Z4Z4_PIG|nr:macrophage-expressed gene 1 protein-like [Sus scrofa]